jgi:hypothetical protein
MHEKDRYGGIKTVDELINKLKTEELSRVGKGKNNVEANLVKLFKPAVGEAVADAINETFGEAIELTSTINKSSQYMYRVFEQAFEQEVDRYLKNRKNNKGALSQEEVIEITQNLAEYLPIFDGPASTDRLKNGIAIFDTGLVPNDKLQYGSSLPSIKYMNSEGKIHTMSVRAFVRGISEAYASAGVIPTHTEDAVDMSKTIIDMIKTNSINAIHDAIVSSGKNVQNILSNMNKNIIETSKEYHYINSVANAMREIYLSTKKGEYSFNLSDMRSEDEIEKDKKNKTDEPVSYEEALIDMEQRAEHVWTEREKMFANDVKVDQMPGPGSLYESKAKYTKQKFIDELVLRIERRLDFDNNDFLKSLTTKKKREAFARKLLNTDSISGHRNKILHNLDIIETITKVLNGEC